MRSDFSELAKPWACKNEMGALIDVGAVTSLTDLQTLMYDDGVLRGRIDGNGILHLCLDSLDEALPKYRGLPKALMGVIKEFTKERLRLVIACRAGEFPPYLQAELTAHFGEDGVSRWHMAPLRRKDVRMAATENGLEADRFMKALWEREVQPLAARPITLDLLLGEAVSGSELPSDIWLLYERGCRQLLSERSDSSRFTQPQRMDLDAYSAKFSCRSQQPGAGRFHP